MKWLSTKKVSELLGVSERTIQRNYDKYIYRHVNGVGRGGKQLQIALESLPQEAQNKYNGVSSELVDMLQYTGKQREAADRKAWAVKLYHQRDLSPDEYIKWYNAEFEPDELLTKDKLFRWQRKYRQAEVAGLIDQRGGYNRGYSSIPEEAWQVFYALYMTQQQRSVKLCYDITKRQFPDLPSVSTFERKVKQIPMIALTYYREGEKAFNDKCVPSMKRGRADIASNDIWFSDHHLMDVFIRSEDGQRAVRPWLTVFFDARSNKVVSCIVRNVAPNATAIKKSFRLGVEEYGIPRECYFDNGKDYRSKYFNRDYPASLVNQLNLNIIYATKYHGQAKTVERFFGTLESRFGKRFETYAGQDARKRPECMRVPEEKIVEFAPTMDEFRSLLADYIKEYNQTPSRGQDMGGKCPDQVYAENLTTRHVLHDKEALRLLCGNSDERVVGKNGVSFMNNSYFNEILLSHIGERVTVVYDPDNIDKMGIFSTDMKAICTAQARIVTPFRTTTEEDYNRAAKEKKAARAATKRYQPAKGMDLRAIIAQNQLMEKSFAETGEPATVEHITPATKRNADILRNTDISECRPRVSEEKSVSAALMKYWGKQA